MRFSTLHDFMFRNILRDWLLCRNLPQVAGLKVDGIASLLKNPSARMVSWLNRVLKLFVSFFPTEGQRIGSIESITPGD